LSYCLFEIARRPEIQRKIQDEIDRALKASGSDDFTYENLHEMKYLECCIDEALRLYPPVPFHLRTATKDYKIADSNLTIPKGTAVYIPVLGFQRDPEIYENPMEFRPERFLESPNGGGKSKGIFYSPFGDGPRNCIAMRMGKLTAKIGLAVIMSKFNLELADKELVTKPLEFNSSSAQFVLTPLNKFNIKVTAR
jgi:cytochrome P450 family 6